MKDGLSTEEAGKRLAAEGYNELPSTGGRSPFLILLGVVREPMFGMLLAAAAVYLALGDADEAAILSFFVLLSVMIAVIQEWRSERILETLRDLTSPRALVLRDGRVERIPGRDVVREDLILVAEGDRIPADAEMEGPGTILVDESLLTGESIPVAKDAGGNRKLYAGTLVVRGSARATVTATGPRSEIGKIGRSILGIETAQPHLQKQTQGIVTIFAGLGIVLAVFAAVLYGTLRGEWMEGILSGIALGMTLLPEEFPLVLTVFMVMGAWRISKARVLTRKAAAIEVLGSVTVLCTDKTGTLTRNHMEIVYLETDGTIWTKEGGQDPEGRASFLIEAGAMASRAESFDPMDAAFFEKMAPQEREKILSLVPDIHYGIEPGLFMMAQGFKEEGGGWKIFAKGAPETIARACRFTKGEEEKLHKDVTALASGGLRVLSVAVAEIEEKDAKELPETADGFPYRFLGLVGFLDPVRDDVPGAMAQCKRAGIRVVMMTGDYPETARAIAEKAGIGRGDVLSGDRIAEMDDRELKEKTGHVSIFARITPDQKLRIVNALRDNGEVVGMTGDGVNDAPSLKAAHIGVAMGKRGTDVAREASAIVLLDDDFLSLVRTIALGRRIYDNLKKAMVYVVAVHVPIAGLAFLPLVSGHPLVMTPLLIALMEMVVDPACSVVLEAERAERNIMKRPPRDPAAPLFSPSLLSWGLAQGLCSLVLVGGIWGGAVHAGLPEGEVRSLIFVSLMMVNLVLILVNRSFTSSFAVAFGRRNPSLLWGGMGVSAFFAGLLTWPPAQKLFGFGPLHGHDILLSLAAAGLLFVLLEIAKPMFQKTNTTPR